MTTKTVLDHLGRALVGCALACVCAPTNAQFSYAGLGFEWDKTVYFGSGSDKTAHNQFGLVLGAFHRPWRNVAFGLSIIAPMSQKTNGFGRSFTLDGSRFDNFEFAYGTEARYKPTTYSYSIEQSVAFRGSIRLFLETALNSYVEGSLTFLQVSERVNIFRLYLPAEYYWDGSIKYAAVDPLNNRGAYEYSGAATGLRFGLMPHISSRMYLDLGLGWQFMNLSGETFSYTFSHEWGILTEQAEYVTIKGAVPGTKTTFSINFGTGFFF